MSVSMRVDKAEFTKTLNDLSILTERSLDVFINSRMSFLLQKARDNTPVSSRGQIESDLSVIGYGLNYTKKGDRLKKRARGAAIIGRPRIFFIINALRRKAGLPAIAGSAMAAAVKKMLASRFRAVGSLRNGWKRAIAIIASAAHVSAPADGPNVKMSGQAKAAQPGWSPTAEATYRLTVGQGGNRQVDPRVEAALESAFAQEYQEMQKHLEQKLTDAARKAGAI